MIKRMFSNEFIKNLSRESYARMPAELQDRIDLERQCLLVEEYRRAADNLEQLVTKMLAAAPPAQVNGNGNSNNQH